MTDRPDPALDETTPEDESRPHLITRIYIEDLYGQFTHNIVVPTVETSDRPDDRRLLLMYGDNGSGKTSLLQLVWHLLSPAKNGGHRNALASTAFTRLTVEMHDETRVEAIKEDGLTGPFKIYIVQRSKTLVVVDYVMDRARGVVVPKGSGDIQYTLLGEDEVVSRITHHSSRREQRFAELDPESQMLSYLRNIGSGPFLLADDRNIYNDRYRNEESQFRNQAAGRDTRPASPETSRELVAEELELCLYRASEYLRRLTLGGQTTGSSTANSIYLDVMRGLASAQESEDAGSDDSLQSRIFELGERTSQFERFGLMPHFAAVEFLKLLPALREDQKRYARTIIEPYLDSLQARLDALQEAESIIRTFLEQTNYFLKSKYVTFNPGRGLRIYSRNDERLPASTLSSGERQLLLLLCNTLIARQTSRVFIIDEPELSLNVKWQRKILDSLLACAEGSELQLIVATHSIEIVAGHMERVFRLEDTDSAE